MQTIFGKRLSQYLGFQKVFLALIAVVGLARLGLSLAGLSNTTVTWLSMSAVALAGVLYYGVAVYTKGFGSYKELLPLMFFQALLVTAIAVLGFCSRSPVSRTSTPRRNSVLAAKTSGSTSWPT